MARRGSTNTSGMPNVGTRAIVGGVSPIGHDVLGGIVQHIEHIEQQLDASQPARAGAGFESWDGAAASPSPRLWQIHAAQQIAETRVGMEVQPVPD